MDSEIKKILFVAIVIISASLLVSCSYSFSGASVPAHLKTISISTFDDNSRSAEANLSETITNLLIQKFLDDNNLQISNQGVSDSELSGQIVSVRDETEVISGSDITKRRITIRVKASYNDIVKRTKVFQKEFSAYSNYDNNSSDITTARQEAMNTALEQISEDILLAVVARW